MTENFNMQNTNLLRRAYLFLEDKEWEKADEYAEKVLDSEPENLDAYLCKLMSEFRVMRIEMLSEVQAEISQSKNYVNALKYANANQKAFLENCAQKAHSRFLEHERIKSSQETIKLFSDMIETYRDTQQWNRSMIKRGKKAVRLYLTTCVLFVIFVAALVIINTMGLGGELVVSLSLPLGAGAGIPLFYILFVVGHAKLVRFWDLDYGDDRGWSMPFFHGTINTVFTLGIWGLVKSIKTSKECRGLKNNNEEMDRQINDLQKQIEERKALAKKLGK